MIPNTRRGLSTMRTHINRRMSASRRPHEIYMKLTSLEIERSRRITEREAMEKRMAVLEERLADIAAEQAELTALLANTSDASLDATLPNNGARETGAGSLRY